MSYENGWAALNMQFSSKIPRTEYSADGYHWKLMEAVTGIDTSVPENRPRASREFRKRWDYSFVWSILVERNFMKEAGAVITDMGHAVYGEDDFNTSVTHPYQEPEDVYALDPAEQFRFFDQKDLIARLDLHLVYLSQTTECFLRCIPAVCIISVYTAHINCSSHTKTSRQIFI